MTKRLRSSSLSLKDIAEELGISVMTVSYALRPRRPGEKSPCSARTTARVQQGAAKMGYIPNRVARAMRTRQTGVIGFVAPHCVMGSAANLLPHTQSFVAGMLEALTPVGLHIAMTGVNELEIEQSGQLPIALRERFFDALVVNYGLSKAAVRLIEEHHIPVIYWESGIFAKYHCINRNEFQAGSRAARRLIELGHTRIGMGVGQHSWNRYKASKPMHYSYPDRLNGFTHAIEQHGLKLHLLEGYEPEALANRVRKSAITALVWQSPRHVITLQVAHLLGKSIPKDLSSLICDFDPLMYSPGDMTGGVLYDRFEVGCMAGRLLIKRMETGKPVPSVSVPAEEILDGKNATTTPGKRTWKRTSS